MSETSRLSHLCHTGSMICHQAPVNPFVTLPDFISGRVGKQISVFWIISTWRLRRNRFTRGLRRTNGPYRGSELDFSGDQQLRRPESGGHSLQRGGPTLTGAVSTADAPTPTAATSSNSAGEAASRRQLVQTPADCGELPGKRHQLCGS